MKRLTIICDMDGILADMCHKLVTVSNAKTGANQTVADITDYNVGRCLRAGPESLGWFREPGFFADLQVIPGSVEALYALWTLGHNIQIVSTPSGPMSCYDKMVWMKRHFPFIKEEDIWFGKHKHLVKGDVLIDDGPHVIEAYRKHHPDSFIAALGYSYNEHMGQLIDVRGPYQNSVEAWETIVKGIADLASGNAFWVNCSNRSCSAAVRGYGFHTAAQMINKAESAGWVRSNGGKGSWFCNIHAEGIL